MNDYDRFLKFLKSMEIDCWRHENKGRMRHCDEPRESKFVLTVSQAHFCFDRDKRYIGVVADDMGYFIARGEKEG